MSPDTVLTNLLLEWEERHEQGNPVTPEELCRDYPELLDDLRRRTELLRAVAPWLDLEDTAQALPAFPGFQTLAELGGGGMGVVYQARDLTLDRTVAIKVPRRTVLAGPHARERFQREARVLAQLKHPNIVPVHQADLFQGQPYFVMDYVPGGNLGGQMTCLATPPAVAVALVEKVARAVEHAHQRGILHRDLKPSNILLDEQGEPHVSDFGIAAILDEDKQAAEREAPAGPAPPSGTPPTSLTLTGSAVGTPPYMAPEQFDSCFGKVGPATDVWALGILLYELVTGSRPFSGALREELGVNICQQAPLSPRQEGQPLPARLERVILRCLEKDPQRRYPTAGRLADDLARWTRRFRRRNLVQVIAGTLLCAVVLILPVLPWIWPKDAEAEHEAKLQQLVDELDQGKAVDLILATGKPLSHLVRVGKTFAQVSVTADGTFSVYSPRPALVELLADPRSERYRFSAEVREDGCHGDAEAGIYFAHQRLPAPREKEDLFGYLSFADLGPRSRSFQDKQGRTGSQVALDHFYYVEPGPPLGRWRKRNGPALWYEPPPEKLQQAGPWRRLALEVAPETIQATFDGVALAPLPQSRVRNWITQVLPRIQPDLQGVPVPTGARGGLGLYVYGCKASFRNCRIEPLEPVTIVSQR